jgi:uncharacterized protein YodC (DUF2158 family)
MWERIRKAIFGPRSRFKRGDAVELKDGSDLMVVTEVITNKHLHEPIINCKWYESSTKVTRTNLFDESKLKLFNWHQAKNTGDVVVNRWGKVQDALSANFASKRTQPSLSENSHQLNQAK